MTPTSKKQGNSGINEGTKVKTATSVVPDQCVGFSPPSSSVKASVVRSQDKGRLIAPSNTGNSQKTPKHAAGGGATGKSANTSAGNSTGAGSPGKHAGSNGGTTVTMASVVSIDGEQYDVNKIKSIIHSVKQDNRDKDERIRTLEAEVTDLHKLLRAKDEEVRRLAREMDKLKSVLDLKLPTTSKDVTAAINEDSQMVGQETGRLKKQGVSGESSRATVELRHYEKNLKSRQLIQEAILANDFLKNLNSGQVREIVECMYEKSVKPGCFIIREGDVGEHLYVSAEGKLEVLKNGVVLGSMEPGRTFGELALLYNCNRTASVRAVTNARFWTLDRRVFQTIMMKTNVQRSEEAIKFLKSVPLLKGLSQEKLVKLADALEPDYYREEQYIIREGELGKTFFIIKSGRVRVTQLIEGFDEPQEVRTLQPGDYFGEKALLSEDLRTANVIAMAPGVDVLVLDNTNFIHLIGDLNELKQKDYGDEQRRARSLLQRQKVTKSLSTTSEQLIASPHPENPFMNIGQDDLETVATLGMGGFGRVELVVWTVDKTKSFALKCLKKKHIVDTRQQDHVISEKTIMMDTNCQFICRLYRTFRDNKYIYMLLEACLGGEVWTILRDRGYFDDTITRFTVACVIEGFTYLHSRGIIYRDLKPENLLFDSQGYVKMCDFGFAKKIGIGQKTWTFCGTPEYVAPEVILNKGHDFAADYWSMGILMFELLTGCPPFTGNDPMKIYNLIIKGVDVIEFPKSVSKNAHGLIKRLCRENPAERLGYGKGGLADIKQDKYFQGFDWIGLLSRRLAPPIVPMIKGAQDVSNFDNYPRDTDVPPDETSGWDVSF